MHDQSSYETIILGIDPGLAHTGWGIVAQRGESYRCLAYGCVVTFAEEPLALRLKHIHDEITHVIERFHPTELGIEAIYFGVNARTAFATGQARGAALVACAAGNLVVGEFSPSRIKQVVTGTGTADKAQVQYMVRAILHLDHDPRPDHAADALAAAICQGNLRGLQALESSDGLDAGASACSKGLSARKQAGAAS
jgi:crossover junction endodeoxyribonuclease RuvC